jgi:hypothetical protein
MIGASSKPAPLAFRGQRGEELIHAISPTAGKWCPFGFQVEN